MQATPIPRTLSLVSYGDMALSVINELPPGRSPIATRVLLDRASPREEVMLEEPLMFCPKVQQAWHTCCVAAGAQCSMQRCKICAALVVYAC